MMNNFLQKKINSQNEKDELIVDLRALIASKNNLASNSLKKKEKKSDGFFKMRKVNFQFKETIKSLFKKREKDFFPRKFDFSQVKVVRTEKFNFKNLFSFIFYWKKRKEFLKTINNRKKVLASRMRIFNLNPKVKVRLLKKKPRGFKFFSRLPAFVVILIFLVIPLKLFSVFSNLNFKTLEERIINNSYGGVNSLLAAVDSLSRLDFKDADNDFRAASLNFLAADKELSKIDDSIFSLASLFNDPKIKLASQSRKLLAAGITTSSLGKNLLAATDSLFSGNDDFAESFDDFIINTSLAVADARELKKILASIDSSSLPEEYRVKFEELKNQSYFLFDSLDEFLKLADKLKDLLGISTDKRYLLVFQNNTELRASGGFMGSYALLDLRNGKIKNLEVPAGGTYDLEAGLKGKKFTSPYPLHLVNSLWNFWDANWWPDWPKTARHLMWFYEQSSGPSVDAVISLTPTVIERVLEITGPIDMTEEYGLIINAENFWETVQKVVEYKNLELSHPETLVNLPSSSNPISASVPLSQDLENNPENKPKKIIGDLMARLIEVLPEKISQENLPAIISLFANSASEKQILFYFKDEKAQAEIKRFGLSGEMKASDHDYLMVVDTNIAGQKTDRVMEKNISLVSHINERGEIINELTINRYHAGIKREALVGVRNVNWLRVYVPLGAKLISASGFSIPDQHFFDEEDEEAILLPELEEEARAKTEPLSKTLIYQEEGKTVFANWTMTDPGENTEVKISYLLPFNFYELELEKNDSWWRKIYDWLNPEINNIFPYSFLLQKQPGVIPFPFSWKIELPSNFQIFWQKENHQAQDSKYLFDANLLLNKDYFYGALIKKIN